MMERLTELFRDLPGSFRAFYRHADPLTLQFWIIPMLAAVVFYVLLLVTSWWLNRARHEEEGLDSQRRTSTAFNVWRAWTISAGLTATALCVWIGILSQKPPAAQAPHELSCLISLIVLLVCGILGLARLKPRFTQNRLKDLAPQCHTPEEQKLVEAGLRRRFSAVRWWLLLPVLGLTGLLINLAKPCYVAVVLDNSGSLSEYLGEAKEVLRDVLRRLPPGSAVTVTSLAGEPRKKTFEELVATRVPGELAGDVRTYRDPAAALPQIETIGVNSGSPICEAIWKTYLESAGSVAASLTRRHLVVLTDGEDTSAGGTGGVYFNNSFFGRQADFAKVFEPGNVHIMMLPGETGSTPSETRRAFEREARNDAFDVQDVPDVLSTAAVLSPVLGTLTINFTLPVAAALIIILFFLGVLVWGKPRLIK